MGCFCGVRFCNRHLCPVYSSSMCVQSPFIRLAESAIFVNVNPLMVILILVNEALVCWGLLKCQKWLIFWGSKTNISQWITGIIRHLRHTQESSSRWVMCQVAVIHRLIRLSVADDWALVGNPNPNLNCFLKHRLRTGFLRHLHTDCGLRIDFLLWRSVINDIRC